MTVVDCARFLAEDPSEIVAASFACPWCLAQPLETQLDVGNHDGAAHCVCPECGSGWEVALHAGQVMRLSLAPPATLRVRFARDDGWSATA